MRRTKRFSNETSQKVTGSVNPSATDFPSAIIASFSRSTDKWRRHFFQYHRSRALKYLGKWQSYMSSLSFPIYLAIVPSHRVPYYVGKPEEIKSRDVWGAVPFSYIMIVVTVGAISLGHFTGESKFLREFSVITVTPCRCRNASEIYEPPSTGKQCLSVGIN